VRRACTRPQRGRGNQSGRTRAYHVAICPDHSGAESGGAGRSRGLNTSKVDQVQAAPPPAPFQDDVLRLHIPGHRHTDKCKEQASQSLTPTSPPQLQTKQPPRCPLQDNIRLLHIPGQKHHCYILKYHILPGDPAIELYVAT
jgi:hypothetical protein